MTKNQLYVSDQVSDHEESRCHVCIGQRHKSFVKANSTFNVDGFVFYGENQLLKPRQKIPNKNNSQP